MGERVRTGSKRRVARHRRSTSAAQATYPTFRLDPAWPAPVGPARYVGRVGALAVALGVGFAVATGQGVPVAHADGEGSSADAPSDPPPAAAPAETGTPVADPKVDGEPKPAQPDPPAEDDGPDPKASVSSQVTDLGSGVVISSSGGAHTSGDTDEEPDAEPADELEAEPVEEPDAEPVEEPAPEPVAEPAPVPTKSDAAKPPDASDPLDSVKDSHDRDVPIAKEDGGSEATAVDDDLPVARLAAVRQSDPGPSARLANTTATAPAEAMTLAAAPAPPGLFALPGALLAAASNLVTTVLAPFFTPGPGPAPQPPLLFAVLAWVQRELQRTFINRTPDARNQDITLTLADADDVSGPYQFDVSDDDSTLTYTVPARGAANGPTHGTVTVDQTTGTFTYDPDDAFARTGGTETFTYTVSDAQSAGHLHGLGGAHTDTATVTIHVVATNDAPVAGNPKFGIDSVDQVTGVVTGHVNVTDPDGDTLTYVAIAPDPADGTVTVDSTTGVWRYTPTAQARLEAYTTDAAQDAVTFNVIASDGLRATAVAVTAPIDPTEAAVTGTIDVGDRPAGVAVGPNGTRLYVTNGADGTVSVIDIATNTVIGTITVGNDPDGIAVSPDGTRVYVANAGDDTVTVIDAATNTVVDADPATPGIVDPIAVGNFPRSLAISPDGDRVYVANALDGSVTVIDAATNTVIATVEIGEAVRGIAVSPSGDRVYVANVVEGSVSVIDAATNQLVDVDPSTPGINGIPVGSGPVAVVVSPSGDRVYVSSLNNTVSVIDPDTNTVIGTIPGQFTPVGLAISADGERLYVVGADEDATVKVVDTRTNTMVESVLTGQGGGVAITPDGTRIYVANPSDDTVTVITSAYVSTNTAPGEDDPAFTVDDVDLATGVATGSVHVTDPDVGDTLHYTLTTPPPAADGTVTVNAATGVWTYVPSAAARQRAAGTTGEDAVSFTITASDGLRATGVAVSAPIVPTIPVNADPVAVDDAYGLNAPAFFSDAPSVLGNDTDADGDTLTAALVTGPGHAESFVLDADGTFSYTPTAGYLGNDTFTYEVSDGRGGTDTATVTIRINARPVTVDDELSTVEDTPVTFSVASLIANDTDVDGTVTGLTLVTSPNGSLVFNSTDRTFTYTPGPGFSGTDTFTYRAVDNLGGFGNTATVTITVTPASPPVTLDHVTVGNGPSAVAVTPDGTHAYVTNRTDNTVTVIDTATGAVIDTDPLASGSNPIFLGNGTSPVAIAVSPNGTRAYVANSGTNTVTVIDIVNYKVVDANPATPAVDDIRVFNGSTPEGVAVGPDGRYVYVANRLGGVTVIDTLPATPVVVDANPATPDVIDAIGGVGANSKAVAISPDGRFLYVVNATQVSIIDVVALRAVDVDPTTPGTVDSITIGTGTALTGVAVSADGSKVYVTNAGTDTVAVIDPVSKSVVRTITVGDQPIGVAVRGNLAYVANQIDRSVTVIDMTTDSVVGTIPVVFQPVGVAASPDGNSIYLVNGQFNPGTVTIIRNVPSGLDL